MVKTFEQIRSEPKMKTEKHYIPLPVEPMLVDAARLAVILSVSESHIRAMDNSGLLPKPINLGKRKLWDTDEIRAWKNAKCPGRISWMQRAENEKAQ